MVAATSITPSLTAQAIPTQAQPPSPIDVDPQTGSSGAGYGTIGVTVIGTLFIAIVVKEVWKRIQKLNGEAPFAATSSQHLFAAKLIANDVRTKDYFKLDIEAIAHIKSLADNDPSDTESPPDRLLAYSQTKVEACLRNVVATKQIEDIMSKREELMNDLRKSLKSSFDDKSLEFVEISLGKIDESLNYNENNYFDAQVIEMRAQRIHEANTKQRQLDLKYQLIAKKDEIETEKQLQSLEVQLRSEQLKTEAELRQLELGNSEEMATREDAAGKKAYERNLALQAVKLESEKQVLILEEGSKRAIETEKIQHEIELLRKNKELVNARLEMQQYQAEADHKLEVVELDLLIKILAKQQEKFVAERNRAKAAEAINTAIQEEKALCRFLTAKKAAESASVEAQAMNALTEAESIRYQRIPPNDSERMNRMVKDLAPQVMDKLPELLRALAPQPGVLGESNTYTFPEGSGESVQKLMLSTSGLLFLNTLLEGRLGHILEQIVDQMKPTNGSK